MKYLLIFVLSVAGIIAAAPTAFSQYTPYRRFSLVQAEQAAGRQLFKDHCASCHAQKSGASAAFAPTLEGVIGRPAGSAAGFPYSDALKKSGLVWSEDNIRKWLANSAQLVPDMPLPHASITDPAEQIYMVAYLKTLKGPAAR